MVCIGFFLIENLIVNCKVTQSASYGNGFETGECENPLIIIGDFIKQRFVCFVIQSIIFNYLCAFFMFFIS